MLARLLIIITLLFTTNLYAQHEHHSHNHQIKGLAPIGVMADHVHTKDSIMVSYRYMTMDMSDIADGSSDLSVDDGTKRNEKNHAYVKCYVRFF